MNKREQRFIDSSMDEKRAILRQVFSAYACLVNEDLRKATFHIASAESLWGSWLDDADPLNQLKNEIKDRNIGIAKNIAKEVVDNIIKNMAPSRKRAG